MCGHSPGADLPLKTGEMRLHNRGPCCYGRGSIPRSGDRCIARRCAAPPRTLRDVGVVTTKNSSPLPLHLSGLNYLAVCSCAARIPGLFLQKRCYGLHVQTADVEQSRIQVFQKSFGGVIVVHRHQHRITTNLVAIRLELRLALVRRSADNLHLKLHRNRRGGNNAYDEKS